MDKNGKLIVYIACSIDGYIAAPGDDLSFLSLVEEEGEDYGYHEFVQTIDTVVVGRKTYDWVEAHASYPHTDKMSYVVSSRSGPEKEHLSFYNGDPASLVVRLKQEGRRVYCEGGAEIIHVLLNADLVDEMIISYIPILLGGGTSLYKPGFAPIKFKLQAAKPYKSGLVQVIYERDHSI